jgi:biotin transport system substrate-specific component
MCFATLCFCAFQCFSFCLIALIASTRWQLAEGGKMTLYMRLAERCGSALLPVDAMVVVAASLLITLSAKMSVPFYPVPLNMQTLVVVGLGVALGPVRGFAAVLLYLTEGAIGLPVFSGTPERGVGLAYMIGPTGGYLMGFLPATALAGWLAKHGWDRNRLSSATAALLAGAIIYIPGLLWLGAVIGYDKPILQFGLQPFIVGDLAKALLAALIFPSAWRWLEMRSGR